MSKFIVQNCSNINESSISIYDDSQNSNDNDGV